MINFTTDYIWEGFLFWYKICSMKAGEHMNYSELRESLIAYYENKLEKGALMAIDDLFRVKTATEEELHHMKKHIFC